MKKNDIKPIWENYNEWEDFKNDMYKNGNDKEIIKQCYEILISDLIVIIYLKRGVRNWNLVKN